MNTKTINFTLSALALIAIASCSSQETLSPEVMDSEPVLSSNVVPLNSALKTLEAFLAENEGDMVATRSGGKRSFASIDTYYSDPQTRSGDNVPDAYIVNFANDEGFAVLGANTSVDDIIAVTEKGSIDPVTLCVAGGDLDNDELELDDLDSLSFYCSDDDDYYTVSGPSAELTRELILVGLKPESVAIDTSSGFYNPGDSPGAGGGVITQYSIRAPMVHVNWGQSDPYNKFCFRKNLLFETKQALTGCSTTAMAMIVATNEFPQLMYVNNVHINWAQIKQYPDINSLDSFVQDQVSLLMSSIYNRVSKIAIKGATLITPEQIKKLMGNFGYTNVKKTNASSFTTSMLQKTSQMLNNCKPVFISAIPAYKWDCGHSWVIDGAKYSSNNTYLLHFNFGWRGKNNGYFSKNCLNPTKGVEYDDPILNNTDPDDNYKYTWHFRLLTYDIPSSYCTLNLYDL